MNSRVVAFLYKLTSFEIVCTIKLSFIKPLSHPFHTQDNEYRSRMAVTAYWIKETLSLWYTYIWYVVLLISKLHEYSIFWYIKWLSIIAWQLWCKRGCSASFKDSLYIEIGLKPLIILEFTRVIVNIKICKKQPYDLAKRNCLFEWMS